VDKQTRLDEVIKEYHEGWDKFNGADVGALIEERDRLMQLAETQSDNLNEQWETVTKLNNDCHELRNQLKEQQEINRIFSDCLLRAQKLYRDANPNGRQWPDGAVNIAWLLERLEKAETELKLLKGE
jgi:DNA repair exonuclease SbcCD ATPase subunit